MPDQYYQVAMNDSWRWAKVDFFVDHAHHPWLSLLYSTIVLYDIYIYMYMLYYGYRGNPNIYQKIHKIRKDVHPFLTMYILW